MKLIIVTLIALALITVVVSGGGGKRRGRRPHRPPGGPHRPPHGPNQGSRPQRDRPLPLPCRVESSEFTHTGFCSPRMYGRDSSCDDRYQLHNVIINDVNYTLTFCSYNYTSPPNFAQLAVNCACSVQNSSGTYNVSECAHGRMKRYGGGGGRYHYRRPVASCASDVVTLQLNGQQQSLKYCVPEGANVTPVNMFACRRHEDDENDGEDDETEGNPDGETEGDGEGEGGDETAGEGNAGNEDGGVDGELGGDDGDNDEAGIDDNA